MSKNLEVSQWTLRVFSKLSYEFLRKGLHSSCWEWFIGLDSQGFQSFLRCLKRHPDLKSEVLAVLLQIGRYNLLEMLTSLLKKQQKDPKDFFYTLFILLEPITHTKVLKDDLINAGILDYWLDYGYCICEGEGSAAYTIDAKIETLSFFWGFGKLFQRKLKKKRKML